MQKREGLSLALMQGTTVTGASVCVCVCVCVCVREREIACI